MQQKRPPTDTELQKIPLFDEVEGKDFTLLQDFTRVVHYPADSLIFKEGTPGDSMYFILSGEIDIIKSSIVGEDVLLATLQKGSVLGEMSLVDNAARSATARARSESELIIFTRDAFFDLVKNHSRPACMIMLKLLRTLSLRLRQADSRVADIKQ